MEGEKCTRPGEVAVRDGGRDWPDAMMDGRLVPASSALRSGEGRGNACG